MASLISVGQVLDHSLEHCRKHYKELLAITLWMVVASIPSVIGQLLAPSGGDESTLTGGDWLSFAFSLIGFVLVAVASIWMYATLVLAVAEQASGRRTDLRQTYRQGWKAFMPYLLLSVLVAGIVIGISLLTAPGLALLVLGSGTSASPIFAALGTPVFLIGLGVTLFLLVKYSVQLAFAPYVLLLENKAPVQALQGSSTLVKGRWWATFLRFAVPKLVYFLALFVISIIVFTGLEMLTAILISTSAFAALLVYTINLLLSVFFSAVITPLIITTDYYLYDSLRKTR